jgi:sugar lactone lactonase YvrE
MKKLGEQIAGKPEHAVFKSPFGIAGAGDGIVYISDSNDKNLRVYDLNNYTVNYFSKEPIFDRPAGLDIDSAGNLYVVDNGRRLVSVFDRDRRPLRSFGSTDLQAPAYIHIDEERDRIYVSDPRVNKIMVYNLAGVKQKEIGPQLTADLGFGSPQGMTTDKDGNLYVAEMLSSRISVFDVNGLYQRSFGERGDAFYQFEAPKDIAFDSDDNLWVIDNRRPMIYTYSPEGTLLLTTGTSARSDAPLGFVAPTAIHIAPNNAIYVSDRMNRRFSAWRYLHANYFEEHPLTPVEKAALEKTATEAQKSPPAP